MQCRQYSPRATCNCAMYLKKERSVVFIDFCDVMSTERLLPVNNFYHSRIETNKKGLNAIDIFTNECHLLQPANENSETEWAKIPIFRRNFKCARLIGKNNYETFIVIFYLQIVQIKKN